MSEAQRRTAALLFALLMAVAFALSTSFAGEAYAVANTGNPQWDVIDQSQEGWDTAPALFCPPHPRVSEKKRKTPWTGVGRPSEANFVRLEGKNKAVRPLPPARFHGRNVRPSEGRDLGRAWKEGSQGVKSPGSPS
jgi:hypothetical protein